MSNNFSALANSVVEKMGGASNVIALTHCMTRLRFVTKDEAGIDADALKKIKGVMGVVQNGDKCQVIVGNNVAAAYKEVMKLLNLDGSAADDAPAPKVKLTPKVIGAKMLDALVGTMSPLIPAIIGGSMVKLAAMLLLMFNVYEADHSTIILLNTIGDGAFFFLPIMVAASAAIKFKTNMSLAIGIAGVLVHPNFIDLMAQAAEGKHVDLFGIPVESVRYTYTVIPVLIILGFSHTSSVG
ncbi:PTS system [Vibrio sp. JCM 19236]|nr:PTS system [Vibrio sp. JCM 19236]